MPNGSIDRILRHPVVSTVVAGLLVAFITYAVGEGPAWIQGSEKGHEDSLEYLDGAKKGLGSEDWHFDPEELKKKLKDNKKTVPDHDLYFLRDN